MLVGSFFFRANANCWLGGVFLFSWKRRWTLLLPYSVKRGQKSRAAVYHFSTLRERREPPIPSRPIDIFFFLPFGKCWWGGERRSQVRVPRRNPTLLLGKIFYNNSWRRRRSQRREVGWKLGWKRNRTKRLKRWRSPFHLVFSLCWRRRKRFHSWGAVGLLSSGGL